ncbi:hypothetical protein SDC9_210709 [bioreactor metagenome]|uniref:Uncharacterized protein n=1 Tax=bioreactor metagenome TaxID=1076179 RepID=A0A645JHP3_9ZZZZ
MSVVHQVFAALPDDLDIAGDTFRIAGNVEPDLADKITSLRRLQPKPLPGGALVASGKHLFERRHRASLSFAATAAPRGVFRYSSVTAGSSAASPASSPAAIIARTREAEMTSPPDAARLISVTSQPSPGKVSFNTEL